MPPLVRPMATFAIAGLIAAVPALSQTPPAGRAPGRGPGQMRQGAPGGPGGGRGQMRGGMRRQLFLAAVPVEVLDSYVKLKPDQKTRVKAAHDKFVAQGRAMMSGGGPGRTFSPPFGSNGPGVQAAARPGAPGGPGGPGRPGGPGGPGGDFRAMMQQRMEAGQKASKQIEGILTADQKAKVPSMMTELNSLTAGGIPVAALPELKLTPDQKRKITQIGADARKQMEAANGDFQQFRGINQAARDKSKAVLTPAQQAIVEKNRPRRGGFGGGGRGPGGPGGPGGRPGGPGRPGAI